MNQPTNVSTSMPNFFNPAAESLIELEWNLSAPELLMVHRALDDLLCEWTELDGVSTREDGRPIQQWAVEVKPGQWDFAPYQMRRFWVDPQGRRLCLEVRDFGLHIGPLFPLCFVVPVSHHNFVRELWTQVEKWTSEHHYLRGQKIKASGEFLNIAERSAWQEIILPRQLMETIKQNTTNLLEMREVYRRVGIPLKRGIILHGPPGTGKTMIGRAIARTCDCTFILITPSMIDDGDSVRGVFKLAERLSPTILFFEDLDLVGTDRHNGFDREVLGELLSGLDGLDSPEGVITIATTNDLTAIEPALKDRPSRFDIVLEVPAMDAEQRQLYVDRWLKARGLHIDGMEGLIASTNGFTGAQMQELCRASVISAIDRLNGSAAVAKPTLTAEDFLAATQRIRRRGTPRIGFSEG